jgi:hypothetical protein
MPLYLLLPHLARKAWMRQTEGSGPSEEERKQEAV